MSYLTDITGYEGCNGCGVCTLSCPLWRHGRDALYTFAGRALALKGGAGVEELKDSVSACLLCGSCEPVCFMGIPTVEITLKLRAAINGVSPASWSDISPGKSGADMILLPGEALRSMPELLENVGRLLNIPIAEDDGADVIREFALGRAPSEKRVEELLENLSGAGRVVVADGLMKRFLKTFVPGLKVNGLGEALLGIPKIRAALGPEDLYLIEARSYNADFRRLVGLYTGVSRETGCMMNLDLQRVAIPTGSCSAITECDGTPSIEGRLGWILEGAGFSRVVTEAVEDIAYIKAATGKDVIHVSELAGGA